MFGGENPPECWQISISPDAFVKHVRYLHNSGSFGVHVGREFHRFPFSSFFPITLIWHLRWNIKHRIYGELYIRKMLMKVQVLQMQFWAIGVRLPQLLHSREQHQGINSALYSWPLVRKHCQVFKFSLTIPAYAFESNWEMRRVNLVQSEVITHWLQSKRPWNGELTSK